MNPTKITPVMATMYFFPIDERVKAEREFTIRIRCRTGGG
jgi:hypothetical protein